MKFLSKLVIPLGSIPNIEMADDIFVQYDIHNYNTNWFLIDKDFKSVLDMFGIIIDFEDGIEIKTIKNQYIYISSLSLQYKNIVNNEYFTIDHSYPPSCVYWPEFKNITEESALYLKMKYPDIIFQGL